jgi:hypothetical protein
LSVGPIVRFHAGAGARVAQRNSIIGLSLATFVIGMAPDPVPVVIRAVVLGTVSSDRGPFGSFVLNAFIVALALHGVRTLYEGAGGWMRSLPASLRDHRRAIVLALAVVQLPILVGVLACVVLTPMLYHAPLSAAKIAAVPVMVIGAGLAAAPGRLRFVSMALALAAGLLAAQVNLALLAASLLLLAIAEVIAGPLRLPRTRQPRSGEGGLIVQRIALRAIGWRVVAPMLMAALPIGFGHLYVRNNELTPSEIGMATRIAGTIAVVLWCALLADILSARRPVWPWSRSLPWSARTRITIDAISLGTPALLVVPALISVQGLSAVAAGATVPLVALAAAGAIRRGRERISGAGGTVILAGIPVCVALAVSPWFGLACLVLAPVALVRAEAAERRRPVTTWVELHRDAAGDSMAWSAR